MPTIYLAGPLFTLAERNFNRKLAYALSAEGFIVTLPQERGERFRLSDGSLDFHALAHDCAELASSLDVMIAILDGPDVDSGTSVEVGVRQPTGLLTIGVRTDFRGSEDPGTRVNGMFRLIDRLVTYDGEDVEELAHILAKTIRMLLSIPKQ